MLLAVPLFHVAGCHAAMLSCIRTQRKIICMYKWDAELAMQLIESERLTGLMATPAISGDIVRAAQTADYDLSSLIVLGGGGAPRPPEQVREIDNLTEKVVPATGWGMTETNAIGAGIAADDYLKRPASSGQCSAVLDFRIVDEAGSECPIGESGELQVRGTSMFRGYWNRPEADAEAFDGEWFRTGDAARIDEDGFLFIVDRIKDMVIRGGENVYPREVEEFLYTNPKIAEVQVFGIPDEKMGEEICAWVQLHPGQEMTADELKDFCRDQITHFKVPRHVRFVDEYPMTVTGKIQKFVMREQMQEELERA